MKKRLTEERKHSVQMWLGFIIAVFGICLISAGFLVPPMGTIDPTVLAAIGEVFTFSGALIGVDYHYKVRRYEFLKTLGVTPGKRPEEEDDEGDE